MVGRIQVTPKCEFEHTITLIDTPITVMVITLGYRDDQYRTITNWNSQAPVLVMMMCEYKSGLVARVGQVPNES